MNDYANFEGVEGGDPATLARSLERDWGVMGRAGLPCAPECHRLLGTVATGALRLSLGWASTEADVEQALEGVEAMARASRVAVSGAERGER